MALIDIAVSTDVENGYAGRRSLASNLASSIHSCSRWKSEAIFVSGKILLILRSCTVQVE